MYFLLGAKGASVEDLTRAIKSRSMRANNETGIRNLCEVAHKLLSCMPVNAATKFAVRCVLREAVNKSCPQYRGNNNRRNCRFLSKEALSVLDDTNAELIADHAIPISLLIREVYSPQVMRVEDLVRRVSDYSVMVLITESEDDRLAARGLVKSMPRAWDGRDVLARYKDAEIELVENPQFLRSGA